MMVIDASIAGKWVLEDEPDADNAFKILANHISSKEEIIVPEFLFYEIANILATKSFISSRKMAFALSKIYNLQLQVDHPTEVDVKLAAKLAKENEVSAYDMLYVVVAKKHKAQLITSDERFVRATKFRFVKLLKDI